MVRHCDQNLVLHDYLLFIILVLFPPMEECSILVIVISVFTYMQVLSNTFFIDSHINSCQNGFISPNMLILRLCFNLFSILVEGAKFMIKKTTGSESQDYVTISTRLTVDLQFSEY